MSTNTLEAGWLLRQIDAAHERASKLPGWLTKNSSNSTGDESKTNSQMSQQNNSARDQKSTNSKR